MSPNSPVILLTGGYRGLGLAIAEYLIKSSSARLFVVARSASGLEKLKSSFPTGRIEVHAADLGLPGAGREIVDKAISTFGRLDAIIANHGVIEPIARIEDADAEAWKKCFNVNYFSVVEMVQAAAPELRKSNGRVVMVSSGAATTPYLAWGAYGSSKAAMNHLALTLGEEEKEFTTVAVRPGVVDTDMQVTIRSTGEKPMGDVYDKFKNLHKENKLLRPDQPGNVIAKLALDTPKELTGKFLSWNAPELAQYQE